MKQVHRSLLQTFVRFPEALVVYYLRFEHGVSQRPHIESRLYFSRVDFLWTMKLLPAVLRGVNGFVRFSASCNRMRFL